MDVALFLLAILLLAAAVFLCVRALFASGRRRHFLRLGLVSGVGAIAALIAMVLVAPSPEERVSQQAAQKAEAEAKVDSAAAAGKAQAEAAAATEAACKTDLQCWADKHQIDAVVACKKAIERLGQYANRWTDGVLTPTFTRVKWQDEGAGNVLYIGDKIEFQNGFGAWQSHTYACAFDTVGGTVVSADATPGRL
ncbi:hypothetical protein BH23PSE1_BH23PSE1_03050 [soil metagenome]